MHLRTFTAWIAVHIHFIEEDFIDILHYCSSSIYAAIPSTQCSVFGKTVESYVARNSKKNEQKCNYAFILSA